MNISTSSWPIGHRSFVFGFSLLCALLAAPSTGQSAQASSPPRFVEKPTLVLAPVDNTPLAGVLRFTTDTETRTTLTLSRGDESVTTQFDDFNRLHSLFVLGFKPGRQHQLTVSVQDRTGAHVVAPFVLEVTTPPLPEGFPIIDVESDPAAMEPGYTLFNAIPQGENEKFGALAIIVDARGEVVWYQRAEAMRDVLKMTNGNILTLRGNYIVITDMAGYVIKRFLAVGEKFIKTNHEQVLTKTFHHDVFPLESGNLLVLGLEMKSYDNYPTDYIEGTPREKGNVAADVVLEINPQGEIVNRWTFLDKLDPYRIGYGSLNGFWDKTLKLETRDWSHANAVIADKRDGSLIVSLRHQDSLVKLDRSSGKLLWILAPPDNWDQQRFGQYLLKPIDQDDYFFPFHQHAPELMPNGNLLVYDNGNYRTSPFQGKKKPKKMTFSRAVEYAIDEESMTVRKVWEYGRTQDTVYYSGALGDANYLDEKKNVLITHGNLETKEGKFSAKVLEVSYDKPHKTVFSLTLRDGGDSPKNGWRIYRSRRIPSLYPAGTESEPKIVTPNISLK